MISMQEQMKLQRLPIIFLHRKVYVKITTTEGCTANAEITLTFYPLVVVNDATIESCFIDTNIAAASFDLTSANVSTLTNPQKSSMQPWLMLQVELMKFPLQRIIFLPAGLLCKSIYRPVLFNC
jgi:hypothetical protein